MLPQNTVTWPIEYFRRKVFGKWCVLGRTTWPSSLVITVFLVHGGKGHPYLLRHGAETEMCCFPQFTILSLSALSQRIFFFNFLTTLLCRILVSYMTYHWTWALGSESAESFLDCQGNPHHIFLLFIKSSIKILCLTIFWLGLTIFLRWSTFPYKGSRVI